jgi:hypothetical protein
MKYLKLFLVALSWICVGCTGAPSLPKQLSLEERVHRTLPISWTIAPEIRGSRRTDQVYLHNDTNDVVFVVGLLTYDVTKNFEQLYFQEGTFFLKMPPSHSASIGAPDGLFKGVRDKKSIFLKIHDFKRMPYDPTNAKSRTARMADAISRISI